VGIFLFLEYFKSAIVCHAKRRLNAQRTLKSSQEETKMNIPKGKGVIEEDYTAVDRMRNRWHRSIGSFEPRQ